MPASLYIPLSHQTPHSPGTPSSTLPRPPAPQNLSSAPAALSPPAPSPVEGTKFTNVSSPATPSPGAPYSTTTATTTRRLAQGTITKDMRLGELTISLPLHEAHVPVQSIQFQPCSLRKHCTLRGQLLSVKPIPFLCPCAVMCMPHACVLRAIGTPIFQQNVHLSFPLYSLYPHFPLVPLE